MIGLLITLIGSGCMRANLAAFGGNQYKLPDEVTQLKLYFSIQIFFLKTGSFLGRFVNPILRAKVKCFGMNDCYPLAFGVPAVAMVLAFVIFLCGGKFYLKKPPGENMVVNVSRCVAVRDLKFPGILKNLSNF